MNNNLQNPPPIYIINRETSGWATVSLIFGILDLIGLAFCGGFLVAIICGHIALSKIKHSNGMLGGRGMAVAGLIMGYFSLVVVLAIGSFFLFAGASLTLAPKIEQRRVEKERVTTAERKRVEVPVDTLNSYAGNYRYRNYDKNYVIEVSVDDGNLRTKSPTNNCLLLPQSNTEFTPVECADEFTGKITFRKNKQNTGNEMVIRYSASEVVCPQVE